MIGFGLTPPLAGRMSRIKELSIDICTCRIESGNISGLNKALVPGLHSIL